MARCSPSHHTVELAPQQRDQRGVAPADCGETEANGDSRSTYERVLPWLVRCMGSSCRYKRFLSCPGCSSRPNTNYFFLYPTVFHSICPNRPQQVGQAVVPHHLSINKCLWCPYPPRLREGREQGNGQSSHKGAPLISICHCVCTSGLKLEG